MALVEERIELLVKSVVAQVASCEDVVLRDTGTTQLIFRPEIIDSAKTPEAGFHGKLLFRRKAAKERWEDVEAKKLSSVKIDEAVAIELSAQEAFLLRDTLNHLQQIKDEFGVPRKDTFFVGVRTASSFDQHYLGRPAKEVVFPTVGTTEQVAMALALILQRDDLALLVPAMLSLPASKLASIQIQLGLSALDELLREWDEDSLNDDEDHWQRLFEKYPFALEQIFHTPTVLTEAKAYLGGKTISSHDGKHSDFVLKVASTHRAVIVEIKTPGKLLLHGNSPYRGNAWRAGEHLSGSLVQVVTYRDTLMEQMNNVAEDSSLLRRCTPECAVIIGSTSQLNTKDKQRSFERIRATHGVSVMTFDELRARLGRLREIMAIPGSNAL